MDQEKRESAKNRAQAELEDCLNQLKLKYGLTDMEKIEILSEMTAMECRRQNLEKG